MPEAPRQKVTTEIRLPRGPAEQVLSDLGAFYADATRRLHRSWRDLDHDIRATLMSEKDEVEARNAIKRHVMARAGLTSRQFNAVSRSLKGRYDSVRECAKLDIETLEAKISSLRSLVRKMETKLSRDISARSAIAARRLRGLGPTKPQAKALLRDRATHRHLIHQKKRKLDKLLSRLRGAERRRDAAVPSICFGSRKLLRERTEIHPNDRQRLSAWRRKWDASRTGNFILIGSKDETSGNQTCRAVATAEGLDLWIKSPPGLPGYPDRVLVKVPFPRHRRDALLRAIAREDPAAKTAIAWRFVRDPDHAPGKTLSAWRVMVSFDMPVEGTFHKHRAEVDRPVLGVDVNADHLALCLVTADGNPVLSRRMDLPLRGKSDGRRRALVGAATTDVVALAAEHGAVIGCEALDFKRKKRDIQSENRTMGPGYARMLSSFAYSHILTELARKAARAGVDCHAVNPAYTSVIGAVNIARRYGLSTHQAAAGAIARRVLGHSERINYIRGLRGRRHALPAPEDAGRHMWHHWRKVKADEVRLAAVTSLSRSPAASAVDGRGSPPRGRCGVGVTPDRPGRVATPGLPA